MKRSALALLFLAVGCTTSSSTLLGPSKPRPAIAPERVAIYRTAEQVPGKYVEISLISTTQQWAYAFDDHGTYEQMKIEAGQLGANALILDSFTDSGFWATMAALTLGLPTERKGKAIAIYILPAPDDVAGAARRAETP